MSRFFKQTQKANDRAKEEAPHDNRVLEVEKLLETIHQSVDEQLAGLEPPPGSKVEAVLDVGQVSPSAACAVVECPTERYRQIRISRASERVFFPEDETIPAPPALEAYRSLRTGLLRLQAKRSFRTLVISSSGQNEGKTLTSLNLAVCCAQLPQYPVLVVDGDLRGRGLTRMLGESEGPGLSEVLAGRVPHEAAVLATDIPNLYAVGAGNSATPPPELFSTVGWKEFIAWCKESFSLVLIDSPPVLPLADFELISAASEGVILVVRARVAKSQTLEKVLAYVDPAKLVGVALNSVSYTAGHSYNYDYNYRLGSKVSAPRSGVRQVASNGLGKGRASGSEPNGS